MTTDVQGVETVIALEEAKGNVRWLLDHPKGLVDMRGLAHWAGVVERLREEVSAL